LRLKNEIIVPKDAAFLEKMRAALQTNIFSFQECSSKKTVYTHFRKQACPIEQGVLLRNVYYVLWKVQKVKRFLSKKCCHFFKKRNRSFKSVALVYNRALFSFKSKNVVI
jgi:hypothetical protein